MKDKIFLFIIGVLIGAVISTGAFYVYTTTAKSCDCSSNNTGINGGQPPEMQNGQNNSNGTPPEKPSGDNSEAPEKPNDNTTQDSEQSNN